MYPLACAYSGLLHLDFWSGNINKRTAVDVALIYLISISEKKRKYCIHKLRDASILVLIILIIIIKVQILFEIKGG